MTLHARTTAEYYGGHSDWCRIGELVSTLDIPVFGNGDIWGAEDAIAMVNENRVCRSGDRSRVPRAAMALRQYRQRLRRQRRAYQPHPRRVGRIIMRHAELLTEFYDGDERMAVHDLRKHVAWYLKGFPVGGSTRRAFMECESLKDVREQVDALDPNIEYPERVVDQPRVVFALRRRCICHMVGSIRGPRPTRSASDCSATTRWMRATERHVLRKLSEIGSTVSTRNVKRRVSGLALASGGRPVFSPICGTVVYNRE